MITANELRRGNLIINVGRRGSVQPLIDVESVSVSLLGIIATYPDNHEYGAIPLTEAWLLKAGFGVKTTLSEYRFRWIKGKFELMKVFWEDEEPQFCLSKTANGDLSYYAHGEIPKVEYLHQLQNLYFALTGEELEFKL